MVKTSKTETPMVTFSRYGLWFPIVGIIISIIVFAAGAAILTIAGITLDATNITFLSLALYASWGLWALIAWRRNKVSLKTVFKVKGINLLTIVKLLFIALLAQLITMSASLGLQEITKQEVTGNAEGLIPADVTPLMITGIILMTVVFAPLFEEIMFRSLILDGIVNTSRKLKIKENLTVMIGVILSSFFFGMSHVIVNMFTSFDLGSIVTLTTTMLLGLVLAYIRIKNSSLTKNIMLHAMFNSVAVILLILSQIIA